MQPSTRSRRVVRSQLRRAVLAAINQCSDLIQEEIDRLEGNTRRPWVRQWIAQRATAGASTVLLRELSAENPYEYRLHLRLLPNQLEHLFMAVQLRIQRQQTILRDPLTAREKLESTLYYLATGCNFRTVKQIFRIPRSTFSTLLPEVCDAIFDVLKDSIKVPSGPAEWRQIAQGFQQRWNFPGCCGAIDGKHVNIQAPPNCGTEFYNYRGINSVVLLAVADHECRFTYIDIGRNGVMSDGGVFSSSSLYSALEGGMLPEGHCLVGDDAIPLKTYLMKPYKGTHLTRQQKIFNYRLSRARRTMESAFGILASRFRIFYTRIPCALSTVDKIVMACCALHNWLTRTDEEILPPPAGRSKSSHQLQHLYHQIHQARRHGSSATI